MTENDPDELTNLYDDPKHAKLQKMMKAKLVKLTKHYGDDSDTSVKPDLIKKCPDPEVLRSSFLPVEIESSKLWCSQSLIDQRAQDPVSFRSYAEAWFVVRVKAVSKFPFTSRQR